MIALNEKTFSVYVHTCPNMKRYVGITSCIPAYRRFGKNGNRYQNNAHFWSAIQIFGWESIKHEIVAEGLTLEEASNMEIELIAKYKSADSNYGYNHTLGGNWGQPTNEVRIKLSKIKRLQWCNPDFRRKVIEGNKSAIRPKCSPETRAKISAATKGKSKPGTPWSEERRALAKLKKPWNAGKTKADSVSMQKISEALLGRKFSDDALKKMSATRLQKYNNGFSPMWVNNGIAEMQIDVSKESVPLGYVKGRLNRNRVYINKKDTVRYVPVSELDQYLHDGWSLGRGKQIQEAIKSSRRKYLFVFDDVEFPTSALMTEYLRSNGYPDIVPSTVTQICRNGASEKSKYHSLNGRLYRKEVAYAD